MVAHHPLHSEGGGGGELGEGGEAEGGGGNVIGLPSTTTFRRLPNETTPPAEWKSVRRLVPFTAGKGEDEVAELKVISAGGGHRRDEVGIWASLAVRVARPGVSPVTRSK